MFRQDLFDKIPSTLNPNVTGWLMYDENKRFPEPALLDKFSPLDDFELVPADHKELYRTVDHSITLDVGMNNLNDGIN